MSDHIAEKGLVKVDIDQASVDRALANLDILKYDVPRRTFMRAARRSMMFIKGAESIRIHDHTGALRQSLAVKIRTYTVQGGEPTQGRSGTGPRGASIVYAVVGPKRGFMLPTRKAIAAGGIRTELKMRTGRVGIHNRKMRKLGYKIGQPFTYSVSSPVKGDAIIPAKYAHFVEFGHRKRISKNPSKAPKVRGRVQAHPFIRGVAQQNFSTVVNIFCDEVKRGIQACDWNHSRCAIPEQPLEINA